MPLPGPTSFHASLVLPGPLKPGAAPLPGTTSLHTRSKPSDQKKLPQILRFPLITFFTHGVDVESMEFFVVVEAGSWLVGSRLEVGGWC